MKLTVYDMEDNQEVEKVVHKTKLVLVIVLPIVLLFLILYSIDFYLYHRKKRASRGARKYQRMRVGGELVTNTSINKKWKLLKLQKRLSLEARQASLKLAKKKYFRPKENGKKGTVSITIPEGSQNGKDMFHISFAKQSEAACSYHCEQGGFI